jgi:hypothetical protein
MNATLKVVSETLVRYGRERYEDAAIYHGVAGYLNYVGRIPDAAWGELPWSRTWRERWEKGLEHRVREADAMRDHSGEHAAAMLKVAADYTNTDIQAALNFNVANQYLSPFVTAHSGYPTRTSVYHPGGAAPAPYFGTSTVFRPPDSIDEFHKLNTERAPGTGLGVCTISNPQGIDLKAGVCDDALDHFVAEYGEDMLCAEYVASQHDPGADRPFTDYILPAWRCVPTTIRNRAELLYAVHKTYEERWDAMRYDIQKVRDNWFSPGAALAWFHQATAHQQYLKDIAAEVKWLADQGIASAGLVEGMRNRYAEFGRNRAKDIIELAKAVVETSYDMLGGIGDCKSNPVKALTNAMKGFADVLFMELRQRQGEAIGLINIDEQRRKEQTDPGTLAHDSVPFPAQDIDWGDGTQWVANQTTGAAAPA